MAGGISCLLGTQGTRSPLGFKIFLIALGTGATLHPHMAFQLPLMRASPGVQLELFLKHPWHRQALGPDPGFHGAVTFCYLGYN